MADVIEFKRPEDHPDAEFVCVIPTDGQPVKWFKFSYAFSHEGKEYSFDIWAKDFADAEQRLVSLKATAVLSGQLYAAIPE